MFERAAWWYAFCRERLFHDDTERITQRLGLLERPLTGATLIEFGCGSGHYSLRLACRFPLLNVVGVDRSAALISRATARARHARVGNCRFRIGDVRQLRWPADRADVVIASRLLMMRACRAAVAPEAYRILRPGGVLLVAEPLPSPMTSLAVGALRAVATFPWRRADRALWPASEEIEAVDPSALREALRLPPWEQTTHWQEGSYQYAACFKGSELRRPQPPARPLTALPTPSVPGRARSR